MSPLPSVRALGRINNWWYSKVAPVLALSYCSVLMYRVPPWPAARSILVITFVGLCAGSYGHMINDVFDIEVDRRAGKHNAMAGFARWQRFGLCALALGMGFAPVLWVSVSSASLLLLGVEFLLPTIYSVPPLRLKGRGALGLVCDALGAHMVPCLFVISVLAHEAGDPALTHTRSAIAFVWCTAMWTLFLGLIGIFIHEFEDSENDRQSGIVTFATQNEFGQVRAAMTIFFTIEFLAFAGLMVVLWPIAPIVVAAALVFMVAVGVKLSSHWHHYRHYERDATAVQWWQLSHSFYEAYLPVAAAVQCAWIHPTLAALPGLQLALFAASFRGQAAEVEEVLRQALAWISWGGRLDVDSSAKAWAHPVFPQLLTRIRVGRGGSERWNIRLARPGLELHQGREYLARYIVRADRTRKITFGVWQDHTPWDGLGCCEEVEISKKWRMVRTRFTASSSDRRGYAGFWLGAEAGTVYLWCSRVRRVRMKDSVG